MHGEGRGIATLMLNAWVDPELNASVIVQIGDGSMPMPERASICVGLLGVCVELSLLDDRPDANQMRRAGRVWGFSSATGGFVKFWGWEVR